MSRRVALATAADAPDIDEDTPALVAALADHGLQAGPVVWDDPDVGWGGFDAVVIRGTWDYALRRGEFLDWAAKVAVASLLLNHLDVVTWNTDKRYLRDLQAAGVPVVETTFLEPDEEVVLPTEGEFVVKPAVSAGSKDTARYDRGDHGPARAHAEALLAAGRTVMVQPYLASVDHRGETALMYFDGVFSHAVRKGPLLRTGAGFVSGLYAEEDIATRPASDAERTVAGQVLAALPFDVAPAYARIDLLESAAGPVVLEAELTEPSLFLAHAAGSAGRFAAAIAARIGIAPI